MRSNCLWTVTIDGATTRAADANAALDVLVDELRRRRGNRPMRWRVDRDGSDLLVGVVNATVGAESGRDAWVGLWASGILQQLDAAVGDAS
jgi:hypothetical protein